MNTFMNLRSFWSQNFTFSAKWRVVAALALAGTLAGGCSSASDGGESAEGLRQGLTVLQAESGNTVKIAYKKDDRLVYLQTRRGEATPEEYRNDDPTLPAFGTDLKITDRVGDTIYTRVAGTHSDFDTESSDDADESSVPKSDSEQHAQDSEIVTEALQASMGAVEKLGKDFADVGDVMSAAESVFQTPQDDDATDDDGDIEATELSAAKGTLATADVSAAKAQKKKHRIWLWKGKWIGSGTWHSSTRIANYYKGKYHNQKDQCNHGRCPGEKRMSLDCKYLSGWRKSSRKTGHCATGYNPIAPFSHNCNDDSHLQTINIRYNKKHSPDNGSCHDFGTNPDPDGCDPSRW
ncbi:hypothetical protein LZC95_38640 [Pendulispora brunnea]|uniref:Uncharacterized protein n=1 Tax=Pendulispora brunnea TaxID=2905690 RepID=A0ABZ2K558_9BACT